MRPHLVTYQDLLPYAVLSPPSSIIGAPSRVFVLLSLTSVLLRIGSNYIHTPDC